MVAPKILVVDDDGQVRRLLKMLVSDAGYTPVFAENGEDACACFQTEAFALVVTDLNMPGMDGQTLIAKIRERNNTIPIILVTGNSGKNVVDNTWEEQPTAIIGKPFNPVEFGALLAQYVPLEAQK